MKDKAVDFYNQNLARWRALEKRQQRRLLLAVLAVVFALSMTIFFISRPTWVVLFNNLEFSQTVQVREALRERGIRYRVQNARTIEVRQQDHANAVLEAQANSYAFAGVRPFLLDDALQNMGMATSQDTRDEMFRRAQEGDLEVMLMGMEGISEANVTLNLADNRLRFLGIEESSVSVVLTTTRDFDQGQSLALATTIAAAVEGLTIDNVVIVDQHARNIFNGLAAGDDRFASSVVEDPAISAIANMERAVKSLLSPVFTNVRLAQYISVDRQETHEISRVYAPAGVDGTPLVIRQHTLAEGASGIGAGQWEPGAFTQALIPPGYPMGSGGEFDAERDVRDVEYVHNITETITSTPGGRVLMSASNVAVIAQRDTVIRQEDFESDSFVVPDGAIFEEGMSWNNFVSVNQNNTAFIEDDVDWGATISNATGIPVDSVTFMAVHNFLFIPTQETPFNWYTIILFGVLAILLGILVFGMLARKREEEIEEEEELGLSIDGLLITNKIMAENELDNSEGLPEIAYSIDSEVKMQIDKFVDEKPEAVAQLLRSWMNEGWE